MLAQHDSRRRLARRGPRSFTRSKPLAVVVAPPFPQEFDQGRHRGFFNPSNISADGGWRYFLASTTGWERSGSDQKGGVCLFRTDSPADPARWRAWTGTGFTAAFPDPYRKPVKLPDACRTIETFPAPVGAAVRHRGSGVWIVVFMTKADGDRFPESGFYWTMSRNLTTGDQPSLLLPGARLYDDACAAKAGLIPCPSLLDPAAEGATSTTSLTARS